MTHSANPERQPNSGEAVRKLVQPEAVEDDAAEDTRSPKVTERGERAFTLVEPVEPTVEAPPEIVRDLVVLDEAAEPEEDDDRSPKKTDRG